MRPIGDGETCMLASPYCSFIACFPLSCFYRLHIFDIAWNPMSQNPYRDSNSTRRTIASRSRLVYFEIFNVSNGCECTGNKGLQWFEETNRGQVGNVGWSTWFCNQNGACTLLDLSNIVSKCEFVLSIESRRLLQFTIAKGSRFDVLLSKFFNMILDLARSCTVRVSSHLISCLCIHDVLHTSSIEPHVLEHWFTQASF